MEKVRAQYDKFPYPKVSWLAHINPASVAHANYESGAALVYRVFQKHENKKILLLGCGTTEPAAFAIAHPHTRVTAVDFSSKSISNAKRFCKLHLKFNVDFHKVDLLNFCEQNQSQFDYIHCYGVIHHLSDPQKGFAAIRRALKPNGFARVMVYSTSSRWRIQKIQALAKLLNINTAKNLTALLSTLPIDHPLRLTFEMHPEKNNHSGFTDAFLHACENSFTLTELEKTLNANDLILHHWDFSQNIIKLLLQTPGYTTFEKIKWLEASDQWPTSFNFWVSPLKKVNHTTNSYITNPLISWRFKTNLHSTLLRNTIKLTPQHQKCLALCKVLPLQKNIIPPELHNTLYELVQARFILEVNHQ
ncbi:MAG: class I SAM-dependent methyltransferase [Oligoflexia bacterium]|nr:class I SAM-dependent methyltransferase [Oligoflexia bacterium]